MVRNIEDDNSGEIAASTEVSSLETKESPENDAEAALTDLQNKERSVQYLEQMDFFMRSNYGEEAAKPVQETLKEVQAELKRAQCDERLTELKAEMDELNRAVQEHRVPETYKKFSDPHDFAEKRAMEIEEAIKRIESQKNQPEEAKEKAVAESPFEPKVADNADDGGLKEMSPEEALRERESSPPLATETQAAVREAYNSENDRIAAGGPEVPAAGGPEAPAAGGPEVPAAGGPGGEATLSVDAQAARAPTFRERARRGFEWVRDRIPGIATFGFWEIHRAERFRYNRNEVAESLRERGDALIKKTANLNLEDALEEASSIQFALQEVGLKGAAEAIHYENISEYITSEKQFQNKQAIDHILDSTSAELVRRLGTYRNEFRERVFQDEARINAFKSNLQGELLRLQNGQVESDEKRIRSLIQENFDPKYWRRYIYGGVEALLGLAAVKLVISKVFAEQAILSEPITKIAGSGVESGSDMLPMKDTIWNTVTEWLKNHGVGNPTDSQIMELSKQVAQDNGIGVAEWGVKGAPMDTMMQQGHLLKFGGAQKLFMTKFAGF